MRRFTLAAAALALALPVAAQAAPFITVNFTSDAPIPGPAANEFSNQLMALGYDRYTTTNASLILSEAASIEFFFLGSESGFSDSFSAGGVSHTETSSFEDHFATPISIGWHNFNVGGSLANLLKFTSNHGAAATVGDDGFGIYLKANQTSGMNYTTLYFGYDDQVGQQDDNHDDFLIMAQVSPVPEPGTWAMLISGFLLVGSLLRRRQSNGIAVLA